MTQKQKWFDLFLSAWSAWSVGEATMGHSKNQDVKNEPITQILA